MNDVILRGGNDTYKIVLKPLADEHLPYLYKWNSDPEVLYWVEGDDVEQYSPEMVQQIYGGISQNNLCFLIEENGESIGECWLQKMKENIWMNNTFLKARAFMYRNARPLDLARFQYHFENGTKEAVMNVLSYYQNEDGGFGHAVEADCWNPNSIPLHSNTASNIITEIDYEDANHPIIQGLLKWYGSGEHFDGKIWAITVPSNNDYPHASWWHTKSISSCHTDYNGTAQIAGFIVRYSPKDSDLFKLGVRIAKEAIEDLSPDKMNDMHTCVCYLRMAELFEKANATEYIPFDELKTKLHNSVNNLIERDTTKWKGYVCQPSTFISSKQSEFYDENKAISDYECQYIMETQLEDGSWNIAWSWKDYPDEWAISKNWWKGQWIIQNLLYLKGFDIIK